MDDRDRDVSVDWTVADLSRRALHDRCDRGIRGGVDLDPRGAVRGDVVGAQETKKLADRIYMIFRMNKI